MAQDATGTPTPKGIPKFNTAVDAPSGKGFNAAMDAIDTLIPTDPISETIVNAKGDLIVATAADTVTRLPVGTNNQVLTADSAQSEGVKWADVSAGVTILERTYSDQSVSNTTTETSIYSRNIVANTIGATGALDLEIIGNVRGAAGVSGVLTVRLKFGGSTIFTFATASMVNNTTVSGFALRFRILNENATNAQLVIFEGINDAGDAGTFGSMGMVPPVTAAIDTTIDRTLEVTVQWDVANANNTYNKLATELQKS